jgi:ApaG protein
MNSRTTHNITVEVDTAFVPSQSSLKESMFTFAYKITITNHSPQPVQLLRRKWVITDGMGQVRIVEGAGVVGVQPVLHPGESHTYTSGTHFDTPIGKMEGAYTMKGIIDNRHFDVAIPEFVMEYPVVLN